MFVACNAVLKLKFQGLHSTVVKNVVADDIIDFLFQERVLEVCEMHALHVMNDQKQQCRALLTLLHMSENPKAFVSLYRAITNEPQLEWLINQIDEFSLGNCQFVGV